MKITKYAQTCTAFNVEPRTFGSYGDRSFQKTAPKLWNELPCHIKMASSLETFKSSLKTYLFHKAFDIT